MTGMFWLNRKVDVSGVSGDGYVAMGAAFPNGKVSVTWLAKDKPTSVVAYDSMADMEAIHGHDGATVVEWMWQMPDPNNEGAGDESPMPDAPEMVHQKSGGAIKDQPLVFGNGDRELFIPARKPYVPPTSVEPSFFTDTHEIHYLLEHAFRAMHDSGYSYDWAWMGAPTNNLQDDSSEDINIVPEKLILEDIAFQRYAISKGLERPTALQAAQFYFKRDVTNDELATFTDYDKVRELNGPIFKDFGSLLADHDPGRKFGVRLQRLAITGGHSCFAFGLCEEGEAMAQMNRRSLSDAGKVRMSNGFLAISDQATKEVMAIHSYEDSALTTGVKLPANPITFWFAAKLEKFSDAALASFEKGIGAA